MRRYLLFIGILVFCGMIIIPTSSYAMNSDGDVAPLRHRDGIVNIGDALVCLRFALNLETATPDDVLHADVAPLGVDGQPNPDGVITVGDALIILRKAVGLEDFEGVSNGTGEIVVGTSVDLSSQEILPTGDMIIIDNPSHPLNGMEITVPPGAYINTIPFQISAAPVESHTLGALFEPLSPMITVNNGGQYSEEPMTVKIPVTVPENHFAMAFYYDDTKGTLEPMQLISTDSESVTVSTHHFSSFIVTGIAQSVLDTYLAQGIQSGFYPGVDDWSFVNRGSYIAPNGHCSGQSIGALWYYTAKPEGDKPLWDSYDNNFKDWSTPEFWQDDSYGYRFSSVLQKDVSVENGREFWDQVQGRVWRKVNNQWVLVDVPGIGPEGTRNMFAMSMLLTHEPQYASIKSSSGGGHALIVYAVTQDALHVADPNYPGDINRTIYYNNGSFDPYASGDNWEKINAGMGKNYETILYLAKSNLIPSEKIAQRWEEVKNGTIGNGIFSGYEIEYLDEETSSYKTLSENQIFTKNKVKFSTSTEDNSIAYYIYKNSEILTFDSDGKTDLTAGDNRLGFYIVGKVVTVVNGVNVESWEYVDFQYINVIYEPEEASIYSFHAPYPSLPLNTFLAGDTLEIQGDYFQSVQDSSSYILLNDQECEITSWSNDTIRFLPPANLTGGAVELKVVIEGLLVYTKQLHLGILSYLKTFPRTSISGKIIVDYLNSANVPLFDPRHSWMSLYLPGNAQSFPVTWSGNRATVDVNGEEYSGSVILTFADDGFSILSAELSLDRLIYKSFHLVLNLNGEIPKYNYDYDSPRYYVSTLAPLTETIDGWLFYSPELRSDIYGLLESSGLTNSLSIVFSKDGPL